MIINFDEQIYWPWFKHQDLRHANVEKGAKLGSILQNISYFIIKRSFVTGNKYTQKVKIAYAKK